MSILKDLFDFFSAAVDELGAQLDGHGGLWVAMRPDAPANALARLEDGEAKTLLVQLSRCGDSGSAGTDDDNVQHLHPSRLKAAPTYPKGGHHVRHRRLSPAHTAW